MIRERATGAGWSIQDEARAAQYGFAAFELKDASFSHEMEVRAVVEAVPYDAETLEIARMELHQRIEHANGWIQYTKEGHYGTLVQFCEKRG